MRRTSSGQVLLGLCVVVVGVVLLLNSLNVVAISPWRYLPSLIIVIGLWALVRTGFREPVGPLVLIAVGVVVQVSVWPDLPSEVRSAVWPSVLIAVGLLLILRRARQGRGSTTAAARGEAIRYVAVFNGVEDRVSGPLTRVQTTSLFGGATIDLRDTRVDQPPALIDVTCLFGGAEIWLPSDWAVRTDMLALFGGVDDKRSGGQADGEVNAAIQGTILFGGLTLKD